MRYLIVLAVFLFCSSPQASEWPPGLVQSTFDRCSGVGGAEQCRCVVIRLQHKFTFEDMRLAMNKEIAKEALSQMIRAYTLKCLGKTFKDETFAMKKHQSPEKIHAYRFR